jgi:acetyl esterase/lipase
MTDVTPVPFWMGEVDPNQIGFPFPADRSAYRKQTGIEYKRTPQGPLLLDAYRPTAGGPHPLVVMIHGGGWARGGRFEMGLTKWAAYLATAGLAVVSIDYRLAPAATYPAPFQDCLDAVDWAVEHAAELGADPARVGLWGDSAGGHLVLLLATSQTNPRFRGPRLRADASHLGAVVAFYPPTDLVRLDAAEQNGLAHVHGAMPATMLLHGTRDLLVPHSESARFAERLAAAGVRHRIEIVEGGVHGFDRVAPGERGERARALITDARDFLRDGLRG